MVALETPNGGHGWSTLIEKRLPPSAPRETGFVLPAPGFYRGRVCAVAPTGLTDPVRSCAASDGVHYDVTPPSRGRLCVGSGSRARCAAASDAEESATSFVVVKTIFERRVVELGWRGFLDHESFIQSFQWALGSAVGSDDVQEWSDVGIDTEVPLPKLQTSKHAVYATVVCTNFAGLTSNASLRLVFDSTPPLILPIPFARVSFPPWEAANSVAFISTRLELHVPPNAAIDEESGVVALSLEVQDATGRRLSTIPLAANGPSNQSVGVITALPHVMYTTILRATNGAELTSTGGRRDIMFDPSPPRAGQVRVCDARGATIQWQQHTDHVALCVHNFLPPRSKIVAYRVTLSTAEDEIATRILPGTWSPDHLNPNAFLLNATGLTLPCNRPMRVVTEALSGAALASDPVERSLVVDCLAPSATSGVPQLRALYNVSSDAEARDSVTCVPPEGQELRASWGVAEQADSRIARYEYALWPQASDAPPNAEAWTSSDLQRIVSINRTCA